MVSIEQNTNIDHNLHMQKWNEYTDGCQNRKSLKFLPVDSRLVVGSGVSFFVIVSDIYLYKLLYHRKELT